MYSHQIRKYNINQLSVLTGILIDDQAEDEEVSVGYLSLPPPAIGILIISESIKPIFTRECVGVEISIFQG